MNKWIGSGNLTRDPELKSVGDKYVCEFGLAVQRRFKTDQADFFNCSAWGQTGEFISKYFHKGKAIEIVGRVEIRTWEDDNGKRNYATNIIVEEAYFAGNKSDNTNSKTPLEQEGFEPTDENKDELPF